MRGITQQSFVLLAGLATCLLLVQARPSGKDGTKEKDSKKLQQIKGDFQWESKWWTPQEKKTDAKDSKDSWKAFNLEKPKGTKIRTRWWEEDWDEDEWWAPKSSSSSSSSSSNSVSGEKSVVPSKKGENQANAVDTKFTENKEQQKKGDAAPVVEAAPAAAAAAAAAEAEAEAAEPKALPLAADSKTLKAEENDGKSPYKTVDFPLTAPEVPAAAVGETQREKADPSILAGDISPFEDPKPGPYSGARDEAPSPSAWEYHQLSGFGKYIDQGSAAKAAKAAAASAAKPDQEEEEEEKDTSQDKDEKNLDDDDDDEQDKEDLDERLAKIEAEVEEHERTREVKVAAAVPVENKEKVLDQFYGFGLESGPSAPPAAVVPGKKQAGKTDKKESYVKKQSPKIESLKGAAEEEEGMVLKKKKMLKDDIVSSSSSSVIPGSSKENYNKGVIYDVIPGAPKDLTLTHSVKKDLGGGPEYMAAAAAAAAEEEEEADFVSTKADLQTSPNPPPPGLDQEAAGDSETTPLVPSKEEKKEDMTSYSKSHPLTKCKVDQECRKGRMCRQGLCYCLPAQGCGDHHKPVCGSDGVQYSSHCELHRTACVSHVHIKVDHVGSCFTTHDKVKAMAKIQKEDYKDHLLPKPTTTTTATATAAAANTADNTADDEKKPGSQEEVDDEKYDSSDYDDEHYYDSDDDDEEEYYDDHDKVKASKDSSSSKDDQDDDDDDDWLSSKAKKEGKVDSKKIYDYTQDLKKAAANKEVANDNQVDPSPWDHVQEETGGSSKDSKGNKQEDSKGGKKAEDGSSSKGDYDDYQSDGSYKECSKQELAKFKRQLLAFHCKRFQEPNCKLEVKEEREYLTNLMFSYLDMNTDYELSYEELTARQESERFSHLNAVCQLTDLIWYDDVLDADARLSLEEFEQAFNHLDILEEEKSSTSSQTLSSAAPTIHIIPTLATVGNGLELKCGLAAKGNDVVWRRHGVSISDLNMVELLVLDDGSLFFSKMGVHHMGNYSCEDANNPNTLQVHSLKVQMPPMVRVSPHSQIEPSMTDVKFRCHAEGVPKPTISWQMNNVELSEEPHHYAFEDNKEHLIIYKSEYQRDTGAYKCVAKNQAGTSEDVSSLFVIGDKERTVGMGFTSINSGKFAVFHKEGYTAYNPDDCLKHRSVHSDFGFFKFIPDNLDGPLRLCDDGRDCSWGQVVNVKNSFLYVSQPAKNRVVVIETTKNWIPVQVISTDKWPMQLHYVAHLDQVWVVCWNGEGDESNKTIVVVRDASKYVQHRAVHTQPVGNHFDQIQALFIAPNNDLRHSFDYGYVTHNGQKGLTKLDLDNMGSVKAVDLSAFDCVPRSLAFVPIGGHVVVECVSPLNHQTLQLVMDYITDAVVSTAVLSGRPYVSPDSRHVVTVDDLTGKVSVAGVSNEGMLEAAYEVTVSASISDVAFFPASGHGYLLVLTSADDDDIITINLSTGKVDKMKGTNRAATSSDWHPSPVKRAITSGDVFTDYLLAPSKSSISILNVKFRQVKCEYPSAPRSVAAIFVGHQ